MNGREEEGHVHACTHDLLSLRGGDQIWSSACVRCVYAVIFPVGARNTKAYR